MDDFWDADDFFDDVALMIVMECDEDIIASIAGNDATDDGLFNLQERKEWGLLVIQWMSMKLF
jgi:hypothetical protein